METIFYYGYTAFLILTIAFVLLTSKSPHHRRVLRLTNDVYNYTITVIQMGRCFVVSEEQKAFSTREAAINYAVQRYELHAHVHCAWGRKLR